MSDDQNSLNQPVRPPMNNQLPNKLANRRFKQSFQWESRSLINSPMTIMKEIFEIMKNFTYIRVKILDEVIVSRTPTYNGGAVGREEGLEECKHLPLKKGSTLCLLIKPRPQRGTRKEGDPVINSTFFSISYSECA